MSASAARLRFYAESFAPWCERARWALDHHGLLYREIEQVPLLAEVSLRVAARRLLRRATVPLLVDGPAALMGSDEIAGYAERTALPCVAGPGRGRAGSGGARSEVTPLCKA